MPVQNFTKDRSRSSEGMALRGRTHTLGSSGRSRIETVTRVVSIHVIQGRGRWAAALAVRQSQICLI
jgi:hypothetical protein